MNPPNISSSIKKIPYVRFSIDRGGTFTDIYAEIPEKNYYTVVKLLSEDPQNYDDAPREGIRRILEDISGHPVSNDDLNVENISWIRMGTTIATNALLERKGERVALVITRGFRDILEIGDQSRPNIFDLKIRKPDLLYETVVEIEERIRPAGKFSVKKHIVQGNTGDSFEVVTKPDPEQIKKQLFKIKKLGIQSIAIVCIHSYSYPEHELLVGRIAKEMGFPHISLSSQVMPMVKMVSRGQTTVVDAYLTPHIRKYLNSFRSGFSGHLQNTQLLFMQSNGGLSPADQFKGSNAILSGPAGGVVGYAMTTYKKELKQPVIGFDMGGTSTDVSRYAGEYELAHETETAGISIQAPQLRIHTVAAGGGSRLLFRNGMFLVGPESAGADPGPVCYRKNGYLTITDASLLLGRLQPDYFPKIFGKNEDLPLDSKATRQAFEILTKEINRYYKSVMKEPMTSEQAAQGFIDVANANMARAIQEISVMRGYDLQEHILATFGGAGGQHACAIARKLGITQIFIHRFSGILSAYGIGLADVVVERQSPLNVLFSTKNFALFQKKLNELSASATKQLHSQGFQDDDIDIQRFLNMRYQGTDTSFMVLEPADKNFIKAFRDIHRREFNFDLPSQKIVVDDLRVRATGKSQKPRCRPIPKQIQKAQPEEYIRCYFEDGWTQTPIYLLETLKAGCELKGPAIISNATSTILIDPGSLVKITAYGDIEITVARVTKREIGTTINPIQLSIFSNLFMSIAEQMGRALQRTSISTNIKERLDFSCAIFDRHGNLVANAPHIPVHLGSMSKAVKEQIRRKGQSFKKGDVLVTNHPGAGGTHLPDITVITPVWIGNQVVFYTASRGHHAEIGSISPGSMPPFSKTLFEEGACIESFTLVENGIFQEKGIRQLLQESRNIENNLSDLKAQISANQKGIDLLQDMVDHYSLKVVQAYMGHIQENAESTVRKMLKELSQKKGLRAIDTIEASEYMDDHTPIVLRLTINRKTGSALFDFRDTGPQVSGNWNAPKAITYSAVLYALRCLIETDIPLNQGCLKPITIKLKEGSLLAPSRHAAVVGGNVLTSQRITDVILKAFGAAAASQGCMNNFSFGNDHIAYYETIGGGAGAGPGWHGQSGVQTHMTNTRITDPEILELRFPVMLREFSLRKNSGGTGAYRGGNGLIREIEAMEPLNMAILSERRVFSPYGLEGGKAGSRGQNLLIRKNGQIIDLGGKNELHVNPGDRFRIITPGGGGFGKKA
ncbi:MAG: hydantoinase B/oxoprolinase family protein [Candidatus Brocadiaceae bacterium]|nr:hydantoinase B/oxoprolinase family protein [Candidatus Brocadiaceae bacterium]